MRRNWREYHRRGWIGGGRRDSGRILQWCRHAGQQRIGRRFIYDDTHSKRRRYAKFLEARETAPWKSRRNMLTKGEIISGPLVVGVPGQLRGFAEAHKRYGVLKWKALIKPTINLCEKGINVSKVLADDLQKYDLVIKKNEVLRNTFINPEHGSTYKQGEILKLPLYAKTLRVISKEGAEALYTGSLSKQFVKDINGLIDLEDMAYYLPRWEEPYTGTLLNGETFYSAGLPQSGILLTFIFNVLQGFLTRNPKLIKNWIRIVETFKYAYGARPSLGDNPYLVKRVVDNLTSYSHAKYIRQHIYDNITFQNYDHYASTQLDSLEEPYSAYVCVIKSGDAVVLASNLHHPWGAGYAAPHTGIVLNALMLSFSKTCSRNQYTMPYSKANLIERGRRPLTPMSPTIVLDYRRSMKLVIGAVGGKKVLSVIAQVLLRALWFNNTLHEAVEAPRLHHQVFPMTLMVEENFTSYDNKLLKALKKVGHEIDFVSSNNFGGALVIIKTTKGIQAVCDTRIPCSVYYVYS
ncbi:scoloptoxin SSD14 isoform X2 [Aethina tumida]|uniref:scoloptoxin SSD14 isoform X2 n=1 Tax=Aethina tumida TaxID=116153 RepID=UPI00096AE7BE|nr:scoloptoxin SSD14 isoform X2 [Aethina tumida]